MISLPDVTLCAVTCVNHELTARAMNECLRHCSFADAVMITDKPVDAPFRVEIVPHFSGADYAPFVCRNLTKYTASKFNLLVQYDGYIVDPSAWSERFFDYDYIGAKWPWHPPGRRVGNSGFCFRSKKLLDILAAIDLPPTGTFVDDELICHARREEFEKTYGIKIAPEEIADMFAYERHVPTHPSFGFHGMFNFWRHVSDAEMETIPGQIDDMYIWSVAFMEVLVRYYVSKKPAVFDSWYGRMRGQLGIDGTRGHLLRLTNNPKFIDGLVSAGEELIDMAQMRRSSGG